MLGIVGIQFGGISQPAFPIFASLAKTRTKQFAAFEKLPNIQRDVDYFLKNASKVETVEEFIKDRRLMTVALSAFGLEDEMQYLGRIRKVLTESPSDKNALVNKLIDPRFKKIAEAFQFADLGLAKLALTSFVNDIVAKFKTNEFEKFLGERNPALREVEYFRRNIGSVENTFNILGDKVLRSVVTFTLGLPMEIALQSIDKQKALIDARVDLKDFKDSEFLDKFIRRFLILKDAEAAQFGFGFGISPTAPNAFAITLLQNIRGGGINLLV
jgi:hypothetical protein